MCKTFAFLIFGQKFTLCTIWQFSNSHKHMHSHTITRLNGAKKVTFFHLRRPTVPRLSLSAAGPQLFLWSFLVPDFKGAVVRRKVCCCRFLLSLQFGTDSDNNVLHLVLLIRHLPITSSTAQALVWRALGGRLKKHHAVGFGEAHRPLLAHLAVSAAGVTEVTLIPHQEPGRRDEAAGRDKWRNVILEKQ